MSMRDIFYFSCGSIKNMENSMSKKAQTKHVIKNIEVVNKDWNSYMSQ